MKKLLFIPLAATVVFFSCEKEHTEEAENLCPVVIENLVPQIVKDSFNVHYPSTVVQTWFYKDSSSYCALFTFATQETLAQFAENGSFIKEEIETEHDGNDNNHQNSDSTIINPKTGLPIKPCECEFKKEGD